MHRIYNIFDNADNDGGTKLHFVYVPFLNLPNRVSIKLTRITNLIRPSSLFGFQRLQMPRLIEHRTTRIHRTGRDGRVIELLMSCNYSISYIKTTRYEGTLLNKLSTFSSKPVNVTKRLNLYSFDMIGDLAVSISFDKFGNGSKHQMIRPLTSALPDAVKLHFRVWCFRFRVRRETDGI